MMPALTIYQHRQLLEFDSGEDHNGGRKSLAQNPRELNGIPTQGANDKQGFGETKSQTVSNTCLKKRPGWYPDKSLTEPVRFLNVISVKFDREHY